MKKHVGLFLGFVLLTTLCVPGSLMAAAYFEGKVIKIISGHEAGGGDNRHYRFDGQSGGAGDSEELRIAESIVGGKGR